MPYRDDKAPKFMDILAKMAHQKMRRDYEATYNERAKLFSLNTTKKEDQEEREKIILAIDKRLLNKEKEDE